MAFLLSGLSLLGYLVAVVAAIFMLSSAFGALLKYRRSVTAMREFPWAKCHWLLGTLKYFPGPGPEGLKYFREQVVLFPRLVVAWYGPVHHSLALYHPDTIKVILKTAEPKNHLFGGYRNACPWLGDGLLLSGGHKWNRNRRLLTPAFHFDILKPYINIKNQAAETLLSKLCRYSEEDRYVELFSHVSLCTLDIILRCAFSYDNDCQTRGEQHPYVQAVNFLTSELIERSLRPWLYLDFVYTKTRSGKQFKQKCDYVHSVAKDVIENRKETMKGQFGQSEQTKKRKHLDFLDILLTARDENGQGLSDLEIRQEVDNFMFAGHDTTASGISWTLYELSRDHVHQERCRQEVDSILSDRAEDSILWDDLPKLKYLTMCLKEALRLHPPVPMIQRRTTQDHIVDKKLIPAGTVMDLHLYMLHHNPQVWEKPMEYSPKRFSAENIQEMGPFDFLPFSAGPRNCIGQNFAMHEMKIIIARILRKFDLELDPDHVVGEQMSVVIRAKDGIQVKFTPRRQINITLQK